MKNYLLFKFKMLKLGRLNVLALITTALVLLCGVEAKSQNTGGIVYHQWRMTGEAPTHYEVSARSVKCHPDSAAQVHVEVFNEGVAQTAHFKLTITNPATGATMEKEITHSLEPGMFLVPQCENNDHQDLRFNIPSSWTPADLTYSISFIQ